MAIDALVRPLRNVKLFQGLRPLQITEIARQAERIVYRPGQTLIREDENGDAAILVISGDAVRISGPDGTDLAEAVPEGALLGEMAMLTEVQHTSTVIARGQVRALRITRQALHRQMEMDTDLADHFIEQLSHRLSSVAERFQALERQLARNGTTSGSGATYH